MENLQTLKLDKMRELTRYRQRPDAKPYIVDKLQRQLAALENCVDLADSGVNNQLLLLLRDTIWKAMHVEGADDALIIGIRLTDRPQIRSIALADIIYNPALGDPQQDLYELLNLGPADLRSHIFRILVEGIDNYKL